MKYKGCSANQTWLLSRPCCPFRTSFALSSDHAAPALSKLCGRGCPSLLPLTRNTQSKYWFGFERGRFSQRRHLLLNFSSQNRLIHELLFRIYVNPFHFMSNGKLERGHRYETWRDSNCYSFFHFPHFPTLTILQGAVNTQDFKLADERVSQRTMEGGGHVSSAEHLDSSLPSLPAGSLPSSSVGSLISPEASAFFHCSLLPQAVNMFKWFTSGG